MSIPNEAQNLTLSTLESSLLLDWHVRKRQSNHSLLLQVQQGLLFVLDRSCPLSRLEFFNLRQGGKLCQLIVRDTTY